MSDFAQQRRLSFGSVAEQYDRARPSYPDALVDDVIRYAGGPLATGSEPPAGDSLQILEIGAGTGIATVQFAARGAQLTALEPDAAMAAVASQRAATDGNRIRIEVTDFESAQLPAHGFDLIISGTAWHWVTPELRYRLAARALRGGGALAVFWNRPRWEGNPLRSGFDAAYDAAGDAFQRAGVMHPQAADDIEEERDWRGEVGVGEDFTDVEIRRYRWQRWYTTSQYIDLIGTHSDHNLMEPGAKQRLFDGVAAVIDDHGGKFELTYESLLCLARRRPF